ncbi:MAG: sulfotransferase, partial [Desulfobacteraceae bacterium]
MDNDKFRKPDFLIIGAQKSGTTWLWRMIDQHPQTALPQKKEIHYFGGSENYRQGKQWYYEHFADIDKSKITGEASTTYLFDFVPFWHNPSDDLLMDNSLPSLPELINNELPDVKIIAILRNPVRRAISAYNHLMRRVVMKKYTHDAGISPTF